MPQIRTSREFFFNRKKNITILAFLCIYMHSTLVLATLKKERTHAIAFISFKQTDTKKDTTYINSLNNSANKLRHYDADSLLVLSRKALKLSTELNFIKGKCLSLLHIANYYSDNGNHKKAGILYNRALRASEKATNSNIKLSIMDNFARSYYYNGNYAKSLSINLEGVELATAENNDRMLSSMNKNIATLYVAQKDYKEALHFLQKSIRLNDSIGDDFGAAKTFRAFASVHGEIGNFEHAMYNINKSIAIFEEYNSASWIAKSYRTKGDIYLKQKKYKWAIRWYDQSYIFFKKIKNNRGEIELLNGLSKANFGLKNDSIAESYAVDAYNKAHKINSLKNIKESAKILYEINKRKKDFENALCFYEVYEQIKASISVSESGNSLKMLKTKMNRNSSKEKLAVFDKLQSAKKQSFIYIIIAILIIWGIITYMMSKSRKAHKKLNTELQLKQIVLENRENELKEINETKDKLFSIIAHDLRGPIGALLEVLKMMKSGDIPLSEFSDFVPRLIKDVGHISFTLNNLLSWGQTQMNGSTTNSTVVDLNKLVENNINLLSKTAKNKSITLTSVMPEGLLTYSDMNQIDIVIRNLISNALKFTQAGGTITIDAQIKYQFIEVVIKDTGIGMNDEVLNKIFSHNETYTTFGTENEKGTGLGISLCKEMLENNGGNLWAKSKLGKGTSFYFTIPKGEDSYQIAG